MQNTQQNDDIQVHQSKALDNQDPIIKNQITDENKNTHNTISIHLDTITKPVNEDKKFDDPIVHKDKELIKYSTQHSQIKQSDKFLHNKIDVQSSRNRQNQESSKLINQEDKKPVQKLKSMDQPQIMNENQKTYQQQQMYYNPVEGIQPQNQQVISYQMSLPRRSASRSCRFCQNPLILKKDNKISANTICCGVIIALCISPICCWIPCALNSCKDKVEACSSCGQTIHMIKEYKLCK